MSRHDLESRFVRLIHDLERDLEEIERTKAEIEAKLEKLRQAKSALENLPPDLVAKLLEETSEGEEPQGTQFERIAAYLRDQGNAPLTIAEIEAGTGIPRASISAVLYRTHPDEFTSFDMEERSGRGRPKSWRLKKQTENSVNVPPSQGEGFDEAGPFDVGENPDDIPF